MRAAVIHAPKDIRIEEVPDPVLVEAAGTAVSGVRIGQAVVAPFVWSDGTCEFCRAGLQTSCRVGGFWGQVGSDCGQGGGADAVKAVQELTGGVAPARAYIPELLADVLAGDLDPSPVFDVSVDLAGVPGGCAATSDRTALKVLVRP